MNPSSILSTNHLISSVSSEDRGNQLTTQAEMCWTCFGCEIKSCQLRYPIVIDWSIEEEKWERGQWGEMLNFVDQPRQSRWTHVAVEMILRRRQVPAHTSGSLTRHRWEKKKKKDLYAAPSYRLKRGYLQEVYALLFVRCNHFYLFSL